MRTVLLVVVVALVTATLMVAGVLLVLPVAFETQGAGWRAAPLGSAVVAVGTSLLAPLVWAGIDVHARGRPDVGIASVALLSLGYGLVALGVRAAWRAWRR
jgi:hypothetical protein